MQTQNIEITLPEALVRKLDMQAAKEHRSRSEIIIIALRLYLRNETG